MDDATYRDYYADFVKHAREELHPIGLEVEETEHIDNDKLFPILREMGAFGWLVPEELGGTGLTVKQYYPFMVELAKIHGGIRALVHVHNSLCHAFAGMANDEQKAELFPAMAEGHAFGSGAITEPDHGTGQDVGTTATPDGDDYILNGRKWLITNSDFATHFLVVCKVEGQGATIICERDREGFEIEPLPELMGCKGGEHGELRFNDVRVPKKNLIGGLGEGVETMTWMLELSRLLVAASSLGTAERALELASEFAKQRITFGKPIAQRQAVQSYLAEMATDVHALRLMIDQAAEKWDRGERFPNEASICKLFGLEAVGRVTDRALLVHGGIGYTRKYEIDRLYRDARLNWLEEGTPTIQKLVIARGVLDGTFQLDSSAAAPEPAVV